MKANGGIMSDDDNMVDWYQFWEHTREMLDRGDIPSGSFYEKLTRQASSRAITYEEFYYLLGRFPSLVVRHPDIADFPENQKPITIRSRSNWDILDYGDWVATAPGKLLWGAYREGNAENQQIIKGSGTLVQQYVDAAYDVMALVADKGWPAAQVVHGFYGMIRAAWIASESLQFRLEGFSPTVNDQVVLSWVTHLLDARQKDIAQRVKKIARQQIDPGT